MPRLICWNIRHGGGERIAKIAEALTSATPDIVILCEFKPNANGNIVRFVLERLGLVHQRCASTAPSRNSVFIASREKLTLESQESWPDADHWRIVTATTYGVRVLATYFPASSAHRQRISSTAGPNTVMGTSRHADAPRR